MIRNISLTLMVPIFFCTISANGMFVRPSLGGDQESPMTGAGMKHAMINFDGSDISVHLGTETPTPILRELQAPNEFDPTKPWSVLIDKAYNAQHGWLIDGIWSPPTGLAVWIEELSSSPELDVYQGGMYMNPMMIDAQTFDPIFGTDGSSSTWKWEGMMAHNAYAVANPTTVSYSATYRVYLGDAITGIEPLQSGSPVYGSDTVTFNFIGVPEPSTLLLSLAALCGPMARYRR